jgi:L,D-transpeptidase catalytic domain
VAYFKWSCFTFIAIAMVTCFGVVISTQTAYAASANTPCQSDSNSDLTAIANCGEPGVYGMEMRAINAEIAAEPAPNLAVVPIDEKTLYQKAFSKVLKTTDIYGDSSGANVVGNLTVVGNNFRFVNAGAEQNGYVQIAPNQWVPKTSLGQPNKSVSKFSGVLLPNGIPERPFGWMVADTKPSQMPGAKPLPGTKTIPHYTQLYFFAVENVAGWDWYLIGPDQWVIQTRVARLQSVKRPDGVSGKWFAVDLYEQTLIAYQNDTPVFATLISSGLPKFATDEGLFKIWDRYTQVKMSGSTGLDDEYYLPQVPWVMYFNHDDQALHGAYWHDAFGYRHSHGCVNMTITDAQWAFNWTKDSLDAWVYVYSSGDYQQSAPR